MVEDLEKVSSVTLVLKDHASVLEHFSQPCVQ